VAVVVSLMVARPALPLLGEMLTQSAGQLAVQLPADSKVKSLL
jgi:hypothetical protein